MSENCVNVHKMGDWRPLSVHGRVFLNDLTSDWIYLLRSLGFGILLTQLHPNRKIPADELKSPLAIVKFYDL